MPTHVEELVNALAAGSLDFAKVSEALLHQTIPVRACAISAMAKIAETSAGGIRAAALDQLRMFAVAPENRKPQRFGPPLSYLAVEALLRLGNEEALRAARDVCVVFGDVEQPELDAYLISRGVRF